MGSIIKRGTEARPRYLGRIRDIDGAWKTKMTGARTEADAQRIVDGWEMNVAAGRPAFPTKARPEERAALTMTVRDMIKSYLSKAEHPRIHDIVRYRATATSQAGRILRDRIADMTAAKVRRADVEALRARMVAEEYAKNTINASLRLLSTIYNWAIGQELLTVNPCAGVPRFPTERSEDYYSLDEVRRLLALPDLPLLFRVGLYTGMRPGELYSLRWDSVFLDGDVPYIHIHRGLTGPTKTRKPRVAPIHAEVLDALRAWAKVCPKTELGHVFPWPVRAKGRGVALDGPILGWRAATETEITNHVARLRPFLLAADCHVPAHPYHCARHTFITLAAEQGVSGDAISAITHTGAGPEGMHRMTASYMHSNRLGYLAAELAKMSLLPPARAIAPAPPAAPVVFEDRSEAPADLPRPACLN